MQDMTTERTPHGKPLCSLASCPDASPRASGGDGTTRSPRDEELQFEAKVLTRAYSPYSLGIDERILEVQALSSHIRRRRRKAITRSVLGFSVRVIIVAAGLLIGVTWQNDARHRQEASSTPQQGVVPARVDGPIQSDHIDPAIDEMPPAFVYV
jgi:hypothetical protein